VVAPGAHLVERGGLDPVLLPWPSCDGIEPDVGNDRPIEGPNFRTVVLSDDPGRVIGELGWHSSLEQRRRLDEVVVDADQDHVLGLHASPWAEVGGDAIRLQKNYIRF